MTCKMTTALQAQGWTIDGVVHVQKKDDIGDHPHQLKVPMVVVAGVEDADGSFSVVDGTPVRPSAMSTATSEGDLARRQEDNDNDNNDNNDNNEEGPADECSSSGLSELSAASFSYRSSVVEPNFACSFDRQAHVHECRVSADPPHSPFAGKRVKEEDVVGGAEEGEEGAEPPAPPSCEMMVFVSKDGVAPAVKDASFKQLSMRLDDGQLYFYSSVVVKDAMALKKFAFSLDLSGYFSVQWRQLSCSVLGLVMYPTTVALPAVYIVHSSRDVLARWRAALAPRLDAVPEAVVPKAALKWWLATPGQEIARHITSLNVAVYRACAEDLVCLHARGNGALPLVAKLVDLSTRLSQFVGVVREEHPSEAVAFLARCINVVKHLAQSGNTVGAKQLSLAVEDHFRCGLGGTFTPDPLWKKIPQHKRDRFMVTLTSALYDGEVNEAAMLTKFGSLPTPETIGQQLDAIDRAFDVAPGAAPVPAHVAAIDSLLESVCSAMAFPPCRAEPGKERGCGRACAVLDDLLHRLPRVSLGSLRQILAHREETLGKMRENLGKRAFATRIKPAQQQK
jgi:hypothetical protein